jgi:hypothetical protein
MTITQQIIKHTPLYKALIKILKALIKIGTEYKAAVLVLAFFLKYVIQSNKELLLNIILKFLNLRKK